MFSAISMMGLDCSSLLGVPCLSQGMGQLLALFICFVLLNDQSWVTSVEPRA